MRAAGPATLVYGTTPLYLWGVEAVPGMDLPMQVKSRLALDNALGRAAIACDIKLRAADRMEAQCVNQKDLDLGLFVLQQGYATVDRAKVYGTVFETPYLQAEAEAQRNARGLWAAPQGLAQNKAGDYTLLIFGFIIFILIIGAFTFLSVLIMRGFRSIIEAQTDHLEMISRERRLRDKERGIVALMLHSELQSNRAKIEAFLAVYEETLNGLQDTARAGRLRRAGDIVQKQPALDRTVFDRNTDKVDVLGARLSTELIHFYARIKTNPEYVTIEPDTPAADAIAMVENVLSHARRMLKICEKIIKGFEQSGVLEQVR